MYEIITILGPTASGKTKFAVALAHAIDSEIISADSRQVYRDMNIGTGKDLADYMVAEKPVPYHLIDICPAGEKYNLFRFQHDFHAAFSAVKKKGKMPVLCGGTGLYIESVLKGYKLLDVPENPCLRESLQDKTLDELKAILQSYRKLHNKTDVDSVQRAIRAIEIEEYYRRQSPDTQEYPPIKSLIIGISIDRELRREKITCRLQTRLEEGMLDEVQKLLDSGVAPQDLIYYGLEYKYLTLHLMGKISYKAMFEQLEIAIHRFAKRQMTWFRGMERRGFTIHWLDEAMAVEEKIAVVEELRAKNQCALLNS